LRSRDLTTTVFAQAGGSSGTGDLPSMLVNIWECFGSQIRVISEWFCLHLPSTFFAGWEPHPANSTTFYSQVWKQPLEKWRNLLIDHRLHLRNAGLQAPSFQLDGERGEIVIRWALQWRSHYTLSKILDVNQKLSIHLQLQQL
jgi:hypothetical protein